MAKLARLLTRRLIATGCGKTRSDDTHIEESPRPSSPDDSPKLRRKTGAVPNLGHNRTTIHGSAPGHGRPSIRARRHAAATMEPSDYAQRLYLYAHDELDPSSLRAWLVQRLVVDLALEHAEARAITDDVLPG